MAKKTYFTITENIMYLDDIDFYCKFVLGVYSSYFRSFGKSFLLQSKIQKMINCDAESFYSILYILQERDYIKIKQTKENKLNIESVVLIPTYKTFKIIADLPDVFYEDDDYENQ